MIVGVGSAVSAIYSVGVILKTGYGNKRTSDQAVGDSKYRE